MCLNVHATWRQVNFILCLICTYSIMKSFNTHRIRGNVAARSQHLSIAYAWRYFRTRPPFWCACEASEDVFIYRKYFHLVRAKMLTKTRAPHVRRSQLCILNCRKMHPQVRIRALGGGGESHTNMTGSRHTIPSHGIVWRVVVVW